ncbi:MAG: AAA family ATPase [Candidatus Methylacidiphilales bacterium]|nr:ATP-binding protein [Candidatus Methylacidiphilales bacterium]
MLTRIYINNFRSLVNFELKFDRINLLMGSNGSGKTSVFEVLRRIQLFLDGDIRIQSAFPYRDLTRWQSSPDQHFELSLDVQNQKYKYILTIQHAEEGRKCRVSQESLLYNDHILFESKMGEAQLYRDDFSNGPKYPFDWTLSGVGTLQARNDNTYLTRFRQEISKFVVAGISPSQMDAESRSEDPRLASRMENFVSWYRKLSQENMEYISILFEALKKVLPGFRSFKLKDVGGDSKALQVLFDAPEKSNKPIAFDFNELSDGQRALIALYTLIYGFGSEGLTLFLDEPDNYVALREIQPWLSTLRDECGERFEQAILISHHPEIINYLGDSKGRWFERANGPTRVLDVPPVSVEGLTLSETIARGWNEN